MQVMQEPINQVINQVQSVKNNIMVGVQMPNQLEIQVDKTNDIINQCTPMQRLDMINNFELTTGDVGFCSGSDFLHFFPLSQFLKFKQSTKNSFQIKHEQPGICSNGVQGNFVNIRDMNLNNFSDSNIENMFILQHDRKCCCFKWTALCNLLSFWCCNPCNKPESKIFTANGQLIYQIKYSALSMDAEILGPQNNLLYTIEKQCFDGSWRLKYNNGMVEQQFKSKKYMADTYIDIQEQSKYLLNINFPKGFNAYDKVAVLYAFSLIY